MSKPLNRWLLAVTLLVCMLPPANAARQSKVSDTKHNLSASGPGSTKSGTESQVCVFCHTPHGANTATVSPLWNRPSSGATYTPYSSESLDARSAQLGWTGQPLGSSKLCLSCHDGTIALGNVVNAPGSGLGSAISVSGDTATKMPLGAGEYSGYTRFLGSDLSNDHPISITYDSTLSARDGELRTPDAQQRVMGGTLTINTTHPLVGPRATGQGSGLGSSAAGTGLFGSSSTRPVLPLENTQGGGGGTGQVQCTTCHDPHIKESTLTNDTTDKADVNKERNIKFLRRPRFQLAQPTNTYSDGNDIICLACHDKGMQGNGKSWAYSSHANSAIATQTYNTTDADTREFPQGMPVWKVACLNCHDTHTVAGARRLTRSGGDGTSSKNSTLEETCYQCHFSTAVITPLTSVPNIKSDFALTYRMPITTADQRATGGIERHDIGGNFNDGFSGGAGTTGSNCSGATNKCGADFVERQAYLGKGNETTNRHVECTDCHNPHRVVRHHMYSGVSGDITSTQTDKEGTHPHKDNATTFHTNIASGVLRGSWGVEPTYSAVRALQSGETNAATSRSFHLTASTFTVRRGDPGADYLTLVPTIPSSALPVGYDSDTKSYVTREYQICLKCHSTYGYNTPPNLGSSGGGTPAGTVTTPGVGNALAQYTDQAKEFQSPSTHADNSYDSNHDGTADYTAAALGADGGANGGTTGGAFNTHNHRSWHPVMRATGRTTTKRGMGSSTSGWLVPWSNAIGSQTMYCSDCHGSNTTGGGLTPASPNGARTVIPDNTNPSTGAGNPWGPHGSNNPFILKGTWNKDVTDATAFCMKCHDPVSGSSGFHDGTRGKNNLHDYHKTKIGSLQCTWCHIAIPHGWKNKMFLVNLNDVGEEAGFGPGSSKEVAISAKDSYYTQPPYYLEAKLKIIAFSPSGGWDYSNCGSAGKTGGNLIPESKSGRTANNGGNQLNWMTGSSTCSGTPD